MPANEQDMIQARLQPYREMAAETTVNGNSYRGLRIHSLPGLHEHVSKVLARNLPTGSVVELAAGAGALSLRLFDLGYEVTATDAVAENFKAPGVPFRMIDLDSKNWVLDREPCDAVVAVEIVEHLENARHFLRNCRTLIKPGGIAVITTPNVENPVSKAMFCRTGRGQWFEAKHSQHGHISPQATWQLAEGAEEAGFQVVRVETFGDPFNAVRTWWKMRIFAQLIAALDGLPKERQGEILVIVLRRPE